MAERATDEWREVSLRNPALRVIALSIVLAATLGACSIMFFERSLIFFPTRMGRWDTEALSRPAGVSIEDAFFDAEGGARLHGWYARSSLARSSRVLLFFHGNAGNLSDRYEFVLQLVRLGVRVFIIDYRGYGRSEGTPSELGLYQDADAAWKYLTEVRGHDPSEIVIFGKSLGGAPAIYLAEKAPAAGLIAQSTFTSIPDVARYHFPIVPRFLISTKMPSQERISRIAMPKLIVHGPKDEVIPFKLGKRLYEAALEPKRFLEIPNAGHNETSLVGGTTYWDGLRDFLESIRE